MGAILVVNLGVIIKTGGCKMLGVNGRKEIVRRATACGVLPILTPAVYSSKIEMFDVYNFLSGITSVVGARCVCE